MTECVVGKSTPMGEPIVMAIGDKRFSRELHNNQRITVNISLCRCFGLLQCVVSRNQNQNDSNDDSSFGPALHGTRALRAPSVSDIEDICSGVDIIGLGHVNNVASVSYMPAIE